MRPQHSYCPSSEGIFAVHTPIKSPEPSTDLGLGFAHGTSGYPDDAIEAIRGAGGARPGYRALHAKGTLYRGTFTATPEAPDCPAQSTSTDRPSRH
ncbi:catalase family protein [Mycobacterium xenopi 4042]|uniref:Catalase family protein n=1 Tax=Mycobacterium xenopi 4042 TaxID=1299334 RepID=X7ZX74_MYCXE|nr:catalase family protein [Mycobacterium xenopi 4042]